MAGEAVLDPEAPAAGAALSGSEFAWRHLLLAVGSEGASAGLRLACFVGAVAEAESRPDAPEGGRTGVRDELWAVNDGSYYVGRTWCIVS